MFLLCEGEQQQSTAQPAPLKSPQSSKHGTVAETVCSWQSHGPAKAGGKSWSAPSTQPHVPTPGIKNKTTFLYFCVFKETKIPKFSLHEHVSLRVALNSRGGDWIPQSKLASHISGLWV